MYHNISCKPHGNHKLNTCSKFTTDKEKGIKAQHNRKLSVHKGRQQERKKGKREPQTAREK